MSHCTCDYHKEQNKKSEWDVSGHGIQWTGDDFFKAKEMAMKNIEEKKDWEKGNLSTIIEKKKDEFAFFLDGMGFSNEDIKVILPQYEKAIRESVEEALREVRPGSAPNYYDATFVDVFGRAIEEYDSRVKEFMK